MKFTCHRYPPPAPCKTVYISRWQRLCVHSPLWWTACCSAPLQSMNVACMHLEESRTIHLSIQLEAGASTTHQRSPFSVYSNCNSPHSRSKPKSQHRRYACCGRAGKTVQPLLFRLLHVLEKRARGSDVQPTATIVICLSLHAVAIPASLADSRLSSALPRCGGMAPLPTWHLAQ